MSCAHMPRLLSCRLCIMVCESEEVHTTTLEEWPGTAGSTRTQLTRIIACYRTCRA